MGGYQQKPLCYLALVVLPGMCLPAIPAEIHEASELRLPAPSTTPAMAAFYTVNRDGRTVPENPLASGFALSSSGSFDLSHAEENTGKPEPIEDDVAGQSGNGSKLQSVHIQHRLPVTIRIEIKTKHRKKSFDRKYAEFRCERLGFFYTSDGRCVIPATDRVTPVSRRRSWLPVRRMLKE